MIPILFGPYTKTFTTNGYGRLSDCISCTVTEERNGIYECEFEYPITGKWYDWLCSQGGIIGVIHDDTKTIQPFDIYGYTAPINGIVTFYAHHLSYRLKNVIAKPFTATSCAEVMVKLQGQTFEENPFTFWTDKVTAGEFKLTHPDNVRALLSGQSGSVLDVYGKGDYEFDTWTVKLYVNRGVDSGVTIRYGKNLSNITKEIDESNTYTAIAPYWIGSDGTVVYLPEGFVTVGGGIARTMEWTDENGNPIQTENAVDIEFSVLREAPFAVNFSDRFENAPTEEELRTAAVNYLQNNQPWIPKENIKVDFVQLWQTPEYEDVAILQRVKLCDRVSIYYPELGVTAENQKVIKVIYDVLTERYTEMELGEPKTTLAQSILNTVHNELEGLLPEVEVTRSAMQEAIDHATELITGGLGGHVVFTLDADGKPQEILIMDTEDTSTAVNVLRINQNGIGFSSNGYNGPFTSAWTLDGSFVADFITGGTLSANLIKAGILSDDAGLNTWNMLTGEMNLQGNITMKSGASKAMVGNFSYKAFNLNTLVTDTYNSVGLYLPTGGTDSAPERFIGITSSTTSDVTRFIADASNSGYQTTQHQNIYTNNSNGKKYFIEEVYDRAKTIYLYSLTDDTALARLSISEQGVFYDVRNQTGNTAYGDWLSAMQLFLDPTPLDYSTSNIIVSSNQIKFNDCGSNVPGSHAGLSILAWSFVIGTTTCYLRGQHQSQFDTLEFNGHNIPVSSSSSRRYKHSITDLNDATLDPHRLLELPVRQFEYNEEHSTQYYDMRGKTLPGFIAEEVEEIYPAATIHDTEGNIESWDERRIIPGMLALIQEQAKKIEKLEKRIEKLEGKI